MEKEIEKLRAEIQELKRHKCNLQKQNEDLMQKLIDAGIDKSPIIIDASKTA